MSGVMMILFFFIETETGVLLAGPQSARTKLLFFQKKRILKSVRGGKRWLNQHCMLLTSRNASIKISA